MKPSFEFALRLLFFASGFSGLIYEVVWAKALHKVVGCSLHAVTLVMAAFMCGLALGSYLGGRLVRPQANGLRIYAFLEAGIGLFALGSPLVFAGLVPVYVGLHRVLNLAGSSTHALRFLLGFLALVLPAALMGATLPVLSQYVDRRRAGLGRTLGTLYGFNTLGATLGCFSAGFLLVPNLGMAWTVRGAALVNLVVAALAWLMAERSPSDAKARGPGATRRARARSAPGRTRSDPARTRLLLLAFTLSGFFSLGYEVLWTKSIAFFISNTASAFSAMLTTFLFGLGLGGLLVASFADRIKRLWFGFALVQVLIGLSALASTFIFAEFAHPDRFDNSSATPLWFKFLYSSLVMFLPTVLMGLLLPMAGKLLARGDGNTGKSVGILYAGNTLGCMAGAAAMGFAFIPLLGIQTSILLLCALQVLLGLVLLVRDPAPPPRQRLAWPASVAALGLVLIWALPSQGKIYSSANRTGMPQSRSIYYREGAASIVEVLETEDRNRYLIINGSINAVPYPPSVGLRAHRLIAQLPLLLHRDPRAVLLLGLGSGMTAGAALPFDGVQTIDVAELAPEVAGASGYFEPWNRGVARSSKVAITFEDGRNFLLTSTRRYDVITLESIHPKWDAGNSSLYSRDFYRLCESRLNPGGWISQWAPLNGMTLKDFRIIVKTFVETFPHASLWFAQPTGYLAATNAILLGSREPLAIDTDRLTASMRVPELAVDLKEAGIEDAIDLLDGFILEGEALRQFAGLDVPSNTDDWPVLEYGPVVNHYDRILAALAATRSSVVPHCLPPADPTDAATFFERLRRRFEVSQLCIQGDLAHLRGDHSRAIGSYGAAFLAAPTDARVVAEYNNVQFKGNYQFLVSFGKAQSWQPEEVHRFLRILFHRDDEDALLWTGRQYQIAGWREAARAQYRQVLALNPQNAEAARLLGEVSE